MLDIWFFPFLDTIFYWLFFLPATFSLTVISFATGILMIWLYWLTSDQWRMAHEKRRIKVAQNKLMRGDYSWPNIRQLLSGNLNLTIAAFIPAVVTVLLILMLIPWTGSRFGYTPPEVREPFQMFISADDSFTLETDDELRYTVLSSNGEHTLRLRMMGLEAGRHNVTLKPANADRVEFSVGTGSSIPPYWPDIAEKKWYHEFVQPAEMTLQPKNSINYIQISYPSLFRSLGFNFFGSFLPGWLTFYFVFSFFVGIYFKFSYSVE